MLRKIEVKPGEEWAFEFGDKILPVSAIKALCMPIIVFLLVAIAANYGMSASIEMLKYYSYVEKHPMCDMQGNCESYSLVKSPSNTLMWETINSNNTINSTGLNYGHE